MALLALDLGEKRVGVAISKSYIIAEPFATLDFDKSFFERLATICQQNEIEKIIIGLPRSLSGSKGKQEQKIMKIAKQVEEETSVKTVLADERFTTKMAKERAGRIDEEAAAIILQSYLDQNKSK